MEFYRYLNVLRRHLGLVVLLTLLGGGSALGFSLRQHKVYQATATLLINAAAPASLIPYLAASLNNTAGATPVDGLAHTYSVFLQSRSFDKVVVRKLHLAVTPAQLGRRVSSALIPGTNYFTINVTWGDPAQAAAVAAGIAWLFIAADSVAQAAVQNTCQS